MEAWDRFEEWLWVDAPGPVAILLIFWTAVLMVTVGVVLPIAVVAWFVGVVS